jgi:hypothetical protein
MVANMEPENQNPRVEDAPQADQSAATAPRAASGYVPPRVITHSAEALARKAPAVNACGSYTEIDDLGV